VNTQVKRFVFIGALWLAAIGQSSCTKSKGENSASSLKTETPSEIAVKAVPVAFQQWIATVSISGSLRTLSTVDIRPEVGGKLIAIYFKEGDLVQKDQLLAEIDPINYKLAHDQAVATLAVAQAGLARAQVTAEHARTERARAENLLNSGGITQKDHQAALTGVKEADTQVQLAEAQCGQARAAVAIAEKALRDCKIFAAAQGHVQKKFFDKGSLLSPGVSICTLVDNSQLELECVAPSYQLSSIRLDQRAFFTTPTWSDRKFEGIVAAINPVIESDNRSVKLILKISNPGGELRSGMYARGEITTSRVEHALVVSRDSLIPERAESSAASLYVVKEGKTRRVQVQIGGSQQDRVWIRQGLNEGDVVIAEIGPSIKEGTAVRVAK
jgi:membrane fusion protein, multidrug efflux system